jgi:hypothetical protein
MKKRERKLEGGRGQQEALYLIRVREKVIAKVTRHCAVELLLKVSWREGKALANKVNQRHVGFCGAQSGAGAGFLRVLRFFLSVWGGPESLGIFVSSP